MKTLDKLPAPDLMNRTVRSQMSGTIGRVTGVIFDNVHLKSSLDDEIHPVVVTVSWNNRKRSVACHCDFSRVEVID